MEEEEEKKTCIFLSDSPTPLFPPPPMLSHIIILTSYNIYSYIFSILTVQAKSQKVKSLMYFVHVHTYVHVQRIHICTNLTKNLPPFFLSFGALCNLTAHASA